MDRAHYRPRSPVSGCARFRIAHPRPLVRRGPGPGPESESAYSKNSFLPILRPRPLDDALAARAAPPEATVVAGGTGVLVELNRGAIDPPSIIDLSAVAQLRVSTAE